MLEDMGGPDVTDITGCTVARNLINLKLLLLKIQFKIDYTKCELPKPFDIQKGLPLNPLNIIEEINYNSNYL